MIRPMITVHHVSEAPATLTRDREALVLASQGIVHVHLRAHRPWTLGNPYPLRSRNDEERDRVTALYGSWLGNQLRLHKDNPPARYVRRLAERYRHGAHIHLYCFCAPRTCHCDRIKDHVLKIVASEQGT